MNIKLADYFGKKLYVYDGLGHFVSDQVATIGSWEADILDWVEKNVADPNMNMIDVGGEIGTYSIRLCDKFKNIITFEPNIDNFSLIELSIEENNIQNIQLHNKACGREESMANMTSHYKTIVDISENGDVVVIPLDYLKIDNCKFIKIDVEGHEYDVLCGAIETIKINKPVIYLETHDSMNANVRQRCIDFLTELGYDETYKTSDIDGFWEYKL